MKGRKTINVLTKRDWKLFSSVKSTQFCFACSFCSASNQFNWNRAIKKVVKQRERKKMKLNQDTNNSIYGLFKMRANGPSNAHFFAIDNWSSLHSLLYDSSSIFIYFLGSWNFFSLFSQFLTFQRWKKAAECFFYW